MNQVPSNQQIKLNNYPVAVVWVTDPSYRIPKQNFEAIGGIMKVNVGQISRKFGFQPE